MTVAGSAPTVTVDVPRATVRPSGSTTVDLTSARLASPDAFTALVRARTSARSFPISGVVTWVPQRWTWTGSVTTRRASRWMPLPEDQRLLGSRFRTSTAMTFGVVPSVCSRSVRSRANPV